MTKKEWEQKHGLVNKMLEIKCPYCGKRSQIEFSYGGDAKLERPKLGTEVSDSEWNDFVYYRDNPRGEHLELWHHISGCRQWFKVFRNTATHEILSTLKIDEK